MAAAVNLAISGVGWLELTGNIRPLVWVADIGDVEPGDVDLDYTLIDTTTHATVATGTLALVDVSKEFAGVFVGNITPSTALVVGRTYLEHIEQSDISLEFRRDAYATAWPMRSPLITDLLLTARLPILRKYPPGATSWVAMIASAHYTVCQRLIRLARADVLTPSRLVEPETELAIAMALEALGTFGELAQVYRDRFERMMEALRLDLDSDGDGDTDATAAQMTSGMGPAATQPRV